MRMLEQQTKPGLFFALLALGTGGLGVSDLGYPPSPNIKITGIRAIREQSVARLEKIRDCLSMTVTALCKVCDVSRQTYYNWANGDSASEANERLLSRLAEAADVIAHVPGSKPVLLAQPIEDGKNFHKLVSEGEDPLRLAIILRDRTARSQGERNAVREAMERKARAGTLGRGGDGLIG